MPRGAHRLSEINEDARTAICAACGPTSIRRHGDTQGWKGWRCRRAGRTKNKVRAALFAESDGRCEICGETPERSLHLDHDHRTGVIRGLLCYSCNVGLGHFRDNPEALHRAAVYLEEKREH